MTIFNGDNRHVDVKKLRAPDISAYRETTMSFISSFRRSLLISAPIWAGCLGQAQAACTQDTGGNVTCSNGPITAPITVYDAAAAFQPVNGGNSYVPNNPQYPAASNPSNPGYNPNPSAVTITVDPTASYAITTNTQTALADRGMIAANYSNVENPAVNNVVVNNGGQLSLTTNQISQSRLHVIVTDSQVNTFTVNNTGSIAVTQGFFNTGFSTANLSVTRGGTPPTYTAIYNGATLNVMSGIYSDDNTNSLVVNNAAGASILGTGRYAAAIFGRADSTVDNSGTIANTDWAATDTIASGHWAIANYGGTGYQTVSGTSPDLNIVTITNGNVTVLNTSAMTLTNEVGGVIKGDILALDITPQVYAAGLQSGATFPLAVSSTNAGPRDSNITNFGSIQGNFYLGSGTHVIDNAAGATIDGSINVDQRPSQASFTTTVAGTAPGTYRSAGGTDFQGNACSAAGTNTTNAACSATTSQLATFVGGQSFTFTNEGTLTGGIAIKDAPTSLNTITLSAGSSIGANITATGLGDNELILSTGASTTIGTLNSNVSGFTGLTQTDGDWTLAAGTTQTFSTSAIIQGGSLTVDSTLTAPVIEVQNGATLAGVGTLVGNLTNAGTVSPGNAGNPYGTLRLAGTFTQQSGGTYAANIAADGSSNKLAVNGTAALDGTLSVTGAPGRYAPGTNYTILTTSGGIAGDFASVSTTGLPTLIGVKASNDGQNESIALTQKSFKSVARTPNERAVAVGLDKALKGRTAVLTTIDNQSNAANASLLNRIAGQGYANFADPELQSGRAFGDIMISRAYAGQSNGLPTFASFYAADLAVVPVPVTVAPRAYSVWATGYGEFGKTEQRAPDPVRNDTLAGVVGGIDFQPAPGTILGVAAGYGAVDFNLDTTGERGRTDNGQVGAYAGFGRGPVYANASVGYARAEGELTRSLGGTTLQPGGARGNVSGNQFLSAGELGYKMDFGKGGRFVPFAGYQVATFNQDAVREKGGGLFNLNVKAQDFLSARGLAGARFESTFALAGYEASAGLRAAYAREFASVSRTISETFVLAPTVPFSINGKRLDRDRALIGAGLGVKVANGLNGFVRYDNEFSGTDQIQAVRGGLRYEF